MAKLSQLTNPDAVRSAIDEFHALGRAAFLRKYRFDHSRDYFIRDGDDLLDSKPILAAAWGYQFPERGALDNGDFSGGNEAAARALRRLGVDVVTRIQLQPPSVGDEHASRTVLYEKYGGDKVSGIVRFPGEAVVNVFSDAEGRYADDPPTLTSSFGYRGEGLFGPQRVESGGNALLERARIGRKPARFWYRPRGESFSFVSWVVVIGRTWVDGVDDAGEERPELEWRLEAVATPDPSTWRSDVTLSVEEASDTIEDNPAVPEAAPEPSYGDLLARIEARGQARRPTGVVRTDYARSAAARRAVVLRSAGRCENPSCGGMPFGNGRHGKPILDVDHVQDLAKGGEDHPRNMIALCPNCHAVKTRGQEAARWQRTFARIAKVAHEEATPLRA